MGQKLIIEINLENLQGYKNFYIIFLKKINKNKDKFKYFKVNI